MDFLLDALAEVAAEVFASVAPLLNLDLDLVFVDTTSTTYFEVEGADELAELQDDVPEDEASNPVEAGTRAFGHSQDHREDLPQVVLAMAVTRDGVPVRCWTFPVNTVDTAIIRTVTDDLAGENLRATNAEAAAALARPGRYKTVAGNLPPKEVQVVPGRERRRRGRGPGAAVRRLPQPRPGRA